MNKPYSILLGVTLALTACNAPTSQPGTTSTPVAIQGIVSQNGTQLTFNGKALSLSGATVTKNGVTATTADVQAGTRIQAQATLDNQGYHLKKVELERELKGQVTAVTSNTLTLLGQTVTVNALTEIQQEIRKGQFTDALLGNVTVGTVVEVYATPTANGLLATRIEIEHLENETEKNEVGFRGTVSNLNSALKSFDLKTHQVLYSAATVRGTLVNGTEAEVEGTLSGTTLTAKSVHVESETEDEHTGEVEISDVVANLNVGAKTFTLGEFTVDYSKVTLPANLALGARVEVKGTFDTSNSKLIHASRIRVEFEKPGDGVGEFEAEGVVSDLNVATGSFKVGSVGVFVDSKTVIDRGHTSGTLADLKNGLNVEVKFDSTKNALGFFHAVRVKFESEEEHRGGGDD